MLYSVKKLASICGYTDGAIYHWIRHDNLPYTKKGKRNYLVDLDDFNNFISSTKRKKPHNKPNYPTSVDRSKPVDVEDAPKVTYTLADLIDRELDKNGWTHKYTPNDYYVISKASAIIRANSI